MEERGRERREREGGCGEVWFQVLILQVWAPPHRFSSFLVVSRRVCCWQKVRGREGALTGCLASVVYVSCVVCFKYLTCLCNVYVVVVMLWW